MEHARDLSKSAASGRMTLVQEITPEKQPGFLIFFPVYQGGIAPGNVAERQARLQGFVFCVFRAGDLFASFFGEETMGAGVEIFDGTNTTLDNLIFGSAPGKDKPSTVPENF